MPREGEAYFHVPADAAEAWDRLAGGGGASSDIAKVFGVLSTAWKADASDPRTFESWLSERGLKKEHLLSAELVREESTFKAFQTDKRRKTVELVRGVLSGSRATEFYSRAQDFSAALRRMVFAEATGNSKDEHLLVALSILSTHSHDDIVSALNAAPLNPIIRNFIAYLRTKAVRIETEKPAIDDQAVSEENDGWAILFSLVTLSPKSIHSRLAMLSALQQNEVVELANRVLKTVPKIGYGKWLRYLMCAFLCVSSQQNTYGAEIIEFFEETPNLVDKSLLHFLDEPRSKEVLTALGSKNSFHHSILLAHALDSIRHKYPGVLSTLTDAQIQRFQKSKFVPLILSTGAVTLELGHTTHQDFRKLLDRRVKSDKKGAVISWLVRNREFYPYIDFSRVPGSSWKSAIKELVKHHEQQPALELIERAFDRATTEIDPVSWDAVFTILSEFASVDSNSTFTKLAERLLRENPYVAKLVLAREPGNSLLWRNAWRLCDLLGNNAVAWNLIFDLVDPKITEQSVKTWIQEECLGKDKTGNWLQWELIPRLIERHSFSGEFLLALDIQTQLIMTKTLSSLVVQQVEYLQRLAHEWPILRQKVKTTISTHVTSGLNIAIRGAAGDPALSHKLQQVSEKVRSWSQEPTPVLSPSLSSVTAIQFPEHQPMSKELLSTFFSIPTQTPYDAALFFGVNQWAVDLYLSDYRQSWPNSKVLLPQILKSFAHFAKIKSRFENPNLELDDQAKTDLAIALREELADIEEVMAGYFAFRSILGEVGLQEVDSPLGHAIPQDQLSSERHKVIRDHPESGRQRLFGLGIKVGSKIISNARVMKSGDENDRN